MECGDGSQMISIIAYILNEINMKILKKKKNSGYKVIRLLDGWKKSKAKDIETHKVILFLLFLLLDLYIPTGRPGALNPPAHHEKWLNSQVQPTHLR